MEGLTMLVLIYSKTYKQRIFMLDWSLEIAYKGDVWI